MQNLAEIPQNTGLSNQGIDDGASTNITLGEEGFKSGEIVTDTTPINTTYTITAPHILTKRSLINLPSYEKAVENIKLRNLDNEIEKKLLAKIGNNPESLKTDQKKLIESINRLCSEQLAPACKEVNREELKDSILESIALGSKGFGQGLSPSCTATTGGKQLIDNIGEGEFAKLMTGLVLDGSYKEIKLNESGIRSEAGSGKYAGATIAECIFRSSIMQYSAEALETIDPSVKLVYSDTAYGTSSQGVTFIYDAKTNKQIGSFQGMYAQGWVLAQEKLLDCGVEYLGCKNENSEGKGYSADHILTELKKHPNAVHSVAIAYANEGIHNKHMVAFKYVKGDRAYFDNPHKDLDQVNFVAKSDTHKLEENGLESMSIKEFKERLLSASIAHLDTKPGHFNNDYGEEHFSNAVNYFRNTENGHAILQISPIELNKESNTNNNNSSTSKDFKPVFISLSSESNFYSLTENGNRYGTLSFNEQQEKLYNLEHQKAWERRNEFEKAELEARLKKLKNSGRGTSLRGRDKQEEN